VALTKITGQVINDTTGLVVGVTTVGGGLSATDGFFSGIVTAVGNASFSGNVSVGGTLTYEDVTNIDAVGLVTARNGIVVGSGITLSKDGDVFFTGIATGNGSGLTALNATQLTSGTIPDARFPSTLPAVSGANLTGISAGASIQMKHSSFNFNYGGNPVDKTGTVTLTGASTNNFMRIMMNAEGSLNPSDSPQWDDPAFFINGSTGVTSVTGSVARSDSRNFSGSITRIADITSSTCGITFTVGANYPNFYNYVSGNASGICLIEEIVSST